MCKHDTRPLGVSANGTLAPSTNNEEETQAPHRPYSPFHVTFSAEGLHVCQIFQLACASLPRFLAGTPRMNRAIFEYPTRKR